MEHSAQNTPAAQPVLPRAGVIVSEQSELAEVSLCNPTAASAAAAAAAAATLHGYNACLCIMRTTSCSCTWVYAPAVHDALHRPETLWLPGSGSYINAAASMWHVGALQAQDTAIEISDAGEA